MRIISTLALIFFTLAAARAEKPNIIFIMVDDMGYHDLGCYGSKTIQTPNLDRMAAEGMRFTDCYSGDSVCASARSTLMTGYHKGHTPVRGNSGGITSHSRTGSETNCSISFPSRRRAGRMSEGEWQLPIPTHLLIRWPNSHWTAEDYRCSMNRRLEDIAVFIAE